MNPTNLNDARELRKRRLAWLQELARPARREQRLAAVAMGLSGLCMVGQWASLAWLMETGLVQQRGWEALTGGLLALAALALARTMLGTWAQAACGKVADVAKLNFRAALHAAVQRRGPLWLRSQQGGEISEVMVAHADALEGYHVGYRLAQAELMVVPLLILAAVVGVDWIVALILLVTAPWVPVFMMLVGWGAEAAGRKQLQAMARMGAHFADRLKGLGLLRLYGQGEAALQGVAAAADGVKQGSMRVLRIAFLSSTVLEFFASVSVALVAVYFGLSHLGLLSLRDTVPSLGAAMFCLLLAPEFYAPFRRLAAHYHDRANALAAVAEVERVLGELPSTQVAVENGIVHDTVSTVFQDSENENPVILSMANVTLRPHGAEHDVLRGVCLTLRRGERVALVGPSGGGKSTLLEAAAGWLVPREGRRIVAPGARVGYASQRPYLFHGTLAENLRLAQPGASEEALLAAAEAAQVMRFAQSLPAGLATPVGERGVGLSGGEARRVGLARVLLQHSDVLLLDEPTAFLDPDTEAALLQSLTEAARGRTVLMATHSPAAMRWADRVVDVRAWAAAPQGDAVLQTEAA